MLQGYVATLHAKERAKERFGDDRLAIECGRKILAGKSKKVGQTSGGAEIHHVRVDGALVRAIWSPSQQTVVTVMTKGKERRVKEDKTMAFKNGRALGIPKKRVNPKAKKAL